MKASLLFAWAAALILVSSLCIASQIKTPGYVGYLNPGENYTFNLSVKSLEDYTENLNLVLTPRASYLGPFTSISPKAMTLGPYEEKPFYVTLNLPLNMSPGKHTLTIIPAPESEGQGVRLLTGIVGELQFDIAGTEIEKLEITGLSVANDSRAFTFRITAKNMGNTIEEAMAQVEIKKQYGAAYLHYAAISGNTEAILSPGESKIMNVNYDMSDMEDGKYMAAARLTYSGKQSDQVSVVFEFKKPAGQKEGESKSQSGGAAEGGISDWQTQPVPAINLSEPAVNSRAQDNNASENQSPANVTEGVQANESTGREDLSGQNETGGIVEAGRKITGSFISAVSQHFRLALLAITVMLLAVLYLREGKKNSLVRDKQL